MPLVFPLDYKVQKGRKNAGQIPVISLSSTQEMPSKYLRNKWSRKEWMSEQTDE